MGKYKVTATDDNGNTRTITSDDKEAIQATADYWRSRSWIDRDSVETDAE